MVERPAGSFGRSDARFPRPCRARVTRNQQMSTARATPPGTSGVRCARQGWRADGPWPSSGGAPATTRPGLPHRERQAPGHGDVRPDVRPGVSRARRLVPRLLRQSPQWLGDPALVPQLDRTRAARRQPAELAAGCPGCCKPRTTPSRSCAVNPGRPTSRSPRGCRADGPPGDPYPRGPADRWRGSWSTRPRCAVASARPDHGCATRAPGGAGRLPNVTIQVVPNVEHAGLVGGFALAEKRRGTWKPPSPARCSRTTNHCETCSPLRYAQDRGTPGVGDPGTDRADGERMESSWRKSSYSGDNGGECVEVATAEAVLVRDTTDRSGPCLTFAADAWRAFTETVK